VLRAKYSANFHVFSAKMAIEKKQSYHHGCQMAYFNITNPNLGKFGRALEWYILWIFGISCGHLVYFVLIWHLFHVSACFTKKNKATLLVITFRQ
jgi:hypothetical protein